MATHSYKNHEIEVSTRDNGDFIETSAKFKPMHGYLGTFSMWANSRVSKRRSRRS